MERKSWEHGHDLEAEWLFYTCEVMALLLIPDKVKSKSQRVCTIGEGLVVQEGEEKLQQTEVGT